MSPEKSPRPSDWTVMELIRTTEAYLAGRGAASPRLDAELLLAHVLNCPRIALYTRFDQPFKAHELDAYRELVRRRAAREPVAYILGKREFWSREFAVNPGVLIPRPDTERLVEAALEALPPADEGGKKRVLELGAGSGAVIVTLALERPGHTYAATDTSLQALKTARDNCLRLSAPGVEFLAGSWFRPFKEEARFDLIVSNPPYIPGPVLKTLEPEVRDFEPRAALEAGADGLDALKVLIGEGHRHLAPGGSMLLEMGCDQGRAALDLARKAGAWAGMEILKDYGGRDRVVRMRKNL